MAVDGFQAVKRLKFMIWGEGGFFWDWFFRFHKEADSGVARIFPWRGTKFDLGPKIFECLFSSFFLLATVFEEKYTSFKTILLGFFSAEARVQNSLSSDRYFWTFVGNAMWQRGLTWKLSEVWSRGRGLGAEEPPEASGFCRLATPYWAASL